MRRIIIALIVLVILGAVGFFGYQQYTARAQAQEEEPTYETIEVARSSIESTISATGNVEAEREVSLSFRGGGAIESVLVQEGDSVTEGQLLATLESDDLALALAQARATLEINRAQLDKLEQPVERNDVVSAQAAIEVAQASVASAEAALGSAQSSYNQLFVGPDDAQRTVNEANLRQAEANVRQAQSAYNQVRDRADVGALPQSAQLEQATVALEAARAQAELTDQPPNQAQIDGALANISQGELTLRQAQSNLITAQDNLQTLIEGPSSEDVAIAQAQVRQAELNVLQAERALQNAQLVAPFAGVVSTLNLNEGELYNAALPAVVLTDISGYDLTVLVDEIDVRQIAAGQPVRITVDALPDAELTGEVTRVSPTSQNVNGVIAYAVEITPEATDAPLRPGMSAAATITTAAVDNVIIVPNRYIQLDRENDRAFVYRVVDGEPALQEVELGLRNESNSQLLAGVSEGDALALVTQSSEEQLRGALFGGQ